MRYIRLFTVIVLVGLLTLPSVALAHSDGHQPGNGSHDGDHYFPETGHMMPGEFHDYWQQHGGLPVFGYPMTEQHSEHGMLVQYLERQRFEYHPEYAGTTYEVLLGRLGHEDAQRRGLMGTRSFQPLPGGPHGSESMFFGETGHNLGLGFRAYWETHGLDLGDPGVSYRESLALFGYPISEEFTDPSTGLTVQYFERARFEYHSANPAPYQVLLGRLGADAAATSHE